jgi:hypothetical protein
MEAIRSSGTSVPTRTTRRNVLEDGILHSDSLENLKSYIALTVWALYCRRNVSPVKYELCFYISEGGILHSDSRENLKSYIETTCCVHFQCGDISTFLFLLYLRQEFLV